MREGVAQRQGLKERAQSRGLGPGEAELGLGLTVSPSTASSLPYPPRLTIREKATTLSLLTSAELPCPGSCR